MYMEGEEAPTYPFDVQAVEELTRRFFIVEDMHIYYGYPRFIIRLDDGFRDKFMEYVNRLKENGYIAFARKLDEERAEIIINKYPLVESKPSRKPLILFFITLAVIVIDAYIKTQSPLLYELIPAYTPLMTGILYTVGLLSIIGIHELGHLVMIRKYGVDASMPYFIPGIPGVPGFIPTFGAVISQREPPNNRDSLFDIGLAGPLAGLIPTFLILFYSLPHTPVLTQEEYQEFLTKLGRDPIPFPVPWLYVKILYTFRDIPPDSVILLDPLSFVAVLGMLITGLNLIPAWQLDGGHLARAMFGEERHKTITFLAILFMVLIGFIAFAAIIIFFYMLSGGRSVRPLNDITPLSTGRKILYVLSVILGFMLLPLPLGV